MAIDIARVRADTPACADLVHLNNAGASLPPTPVVDAVIAHVRAEAALGGYEAAAAAPGADAVYGAGGRLLHCSPDEIAFTVSASDAWWRAWSSIPLEAGDRIVTGRAEYVSNAFGLSQAQDRGVEVVLVENDSSGQIDLDALASKLDGRVKVVALTHVPTSSGLVNPAVEVGALAKDVGAIYLLDACQSAGQMPLDVAELQCDFLSLTGRKFLRGPRGSGLLYARAGVMDRLRPHPFIDGRSANWTGPLSYDLEPNARRFELFEVSYAAKIGFGVAIDYALGVGIDAIAARIAPLADTLRSQLEGIDAVSVRDPGERRCGIVTFTVDGTDAQRVVDALRAEHINTSVSAASGAQLDLVHRGVPDVVRASVHYFNTEEELVRLVDAVRVLSLAAP